MANNRTRLTPNRSEQKSSDTAINVMLAILTVFAPPVGILAFIIKALVSGGKKKKAGIDSASDWKTTTQSAARRVVRHMTSADNQEENVASWPSKHGHTPLAYSYDSCALDKRLDQLKSLYEAGLYTKEQYQEAKAKAVAMSRQG